MSFPAQSVKEILDDLGTLGPIRIGGMDDSPDVLGAIKEYGGRSPEFRFGVVGIGYERPAIQIVFRGEPHDYDGPMVRARLAWQALAAIQPDEIPTEGYKYLTVTPQQSPFGLGQDNSYRHEIVCNYYLVLEPL